LFRSFITRAASLRPEADLTREPDFDHTNTGGVIDEVPAAPSA
jgi:hypothetical protein